ncbi:hypothetical protein ISN44_As03g039570 [Arabidopsis suecica]|uniref:F-box protein At3g26010-like beta-propeller domain-containing protein n=1 Tax=Arabidopsis suecica TaxID=45249 RepID=A0A8T2FCJ2_ARASU|nr:hypothetical protein ISN44_As03g039570 [Arabidopsis suecica]
MTEKQHDQASMREEAVLPEVVVAHYECETWGLPRSLSSYISSFITHKFNTQFPNVTLVVAYTHVGLILISSGNKLLTYYVAANPISRQCVEIPQPPPTVGLYFTSGLVTKLEDHVVLGYKVVLMDTSNLDDVISLLIYSSETGLWSFKTLQSHLTLSGLIDYNPVSLYGNLYWIGYNNNYGEVVVFHDFYATGTESDRCQVTPFPDGGTKPPNLK